MRAIAQFVVVVGVVLGVASCAVFTPLPEPRTLEQRLAMLPTKGLPVGAPVTVWWNERHVPFIEAASDRDAAFTLGLVHAHLRLGQMEVMRRVSQARISEMAGPIPQFGDMLMSAIAQGGEAAKQRVRDFLGKRAGKVGKAS